MASTITASSTIDVQGMVASLMRVESRPLTLMVAEARKIDTKISAYGKLQSQIASFRDAAAKLSSLDTWRAVKASSSNANAVEVSAGAGAGTSQHAIEVQALAQSQTVASGTFANADAVVGGGTLRLQLGSQPTGATSFSPDAGRPETAITIAAGATLGEVRDAINSAGAGVRASLVKDGDQVRLFVTSSDSGGNQAFRMRVDDADGVGTDTAGLSAIAFDPPAAVGAGRNLSLIRGAADAEYTIDGLPLTARSNRIAGALDGVDLVLKQVTTEPVLADIIADSEALNTSATAFVDAYNALNTLLAEQTKYDETTKVAGTLQGDRSAVGILSQVRSIVRETVTGGSLTRLADAGFELQRDGSLKLNSTKFASAAVDPTNLEALLSAPGTGATDKGLMVRFRELGDRMLSTEGAVTTANNAWQARLTANKKRQEALETRLTDVEKRLLRQYTTLDTQLAAAQQSSAALQSALAGLPKR
jgi:flagellar hook-associated protein 2